MKVKNITQVADNKNGCGSWLKQWEKSTGINAVYCSEKRCLQKCNLLGVQVQKVNIESKLTLLNMFKALVPASDSTWYIIPLCENHCKCNEELEITDIVPLVPIAKNKLDAIAENKYLERRNLPDSHINTHSFY